MAESSPDSWRPTATLERLQWRATLLTELRQRFREAGYWEVETPLLSQDICIDPWIDPFVVENAVVGEQAPLYLQTSPEFAMKRLLAAGAEAIFEVTRSFRRGEAGGRHNPEFTMIEWYRRGATYHEQMDFVAELLSGLEGIKGQKENINPARIR